MVAFILIFFASCDSISGDKDPEPTLEGIYAGPASYTIPVLDLDEPLTSTLRMEVIQVGTEMTLSGTEIFFGQQPRALAAITGTVSQTGFFTASGVARIASWDDPECGRISSANHTIAFANKNLRITENILTPKCGTILFSALLVRER